MPRPHLWVVSFETASDGPRHIYHSLFRGPGFATETN